MNLPERVHPAALLLAVAFVAVAAWTWSWPDHPLIPDEAIAKTMVDSVAANGTPFATEPFTEYRSGTFGTDRYGGAYVDHKIAKPPTSIATAFEQGLLGVKAGRALTLLVGTLAVAYLAWRLAGPWAGFFGGLLFLVHPATLYFHQSYFANSGGTAWFLAALALLEAATTRWWLAPIAVAAAGVATIFRVEYALGLLFAIPLGLLVLGDWRGRVAFALAVLLALLALWNLESLVPGLTPEKLFTEPIPLQDFVLHPVDTLERILERYRVHTDLSPVAEWHVYADHANRYFIWFFPLTFGLAMVGLLSRVKRPAATWVYAPLAAQTLLQAYAILPALAHFDFSYVSWLESSVVRYFLVAYALASLLAGVALARLVDHVRLPRLGTATGPAVLLGALLASASVTTALTADHGVLWANERRAWFDAIDEAAASLDPKAVFVGATPGKVIFARPVLHPDNANGDGAYVTSVATDLLGKGHRVFALEPWYWADRGYSIEALLLTGGHTYWTDTGVVVDCTCGEFARFYELHRTNATLTRVARLDEGAFQESAEGLVTAAPLATFYPERNLHVRMGLAETRGVRVTLTYVDEGNATYEAGYWNLPLENPKNAHPLAAWTTGGTGEARTVSFRIPAEEIANGALYVRGPPGLVLQAMEVTEA